VTWRARTALTMAAVIFSSGLGAAQSPEGSISGLVVDGSAAVVPGAVILALHVETATERSLVTDERGRYRVLGLAPGVYRVTAHLPGFIPTVRDAVVVAMGQDVLVDFALQVGLTATVTVEREIPAIGAGSTAVGGIVTTRQIAELPLNGRSFLQLATLQPGVVVSRGTPREFTGGFGATQIAIAGARPEHTGYLLDGTNIADISDKSPASLAGVLLGVDTVQEFSVQTHGYGAEFGRAAGGIVSVVTKAGTNRVRGTVFEFHRNSALDARGAFDSAEAPPFTRNQFGGTLGGPVLRSRVFFFGGYEGLRDRQSVTRYARLPNALAHQGLLPGPGGTLRQVGVHPTVRPYLDLLFPIPGGQDFGDGTADEPHAHLDPVDEHFHVGRLDWHAGAADSFMVRLWGNRSASRRADEHPLFEEVTDTGTRFVTAQHQRVIGGRALHVLRASANRTTRSNDSRAHVAIPASLFFSEDPHWGAITITGVTVAGSTATIPVQYTQDVYQLSNTLSWHRGAHTWKAGADWQRYHFDGFSYSRYGGEFRFRNLAEFLTLRRSATAQADRFVGNLPGTDTDRQVRQQYVATFVHDEWRASDAITVTAGVRYEFVTTPVERSGKFAGLRRFEDLESGPRGVTPGAPLFRNPSLRGFAPRLGVAWRPGRDDRSTLRGGWGLFHQPLTVSFYRGTIFRIYPYFAGIDIRQPPVFGPDMIGLLAAGVDPSVVQKRSEFIAPDLAQPRTEQWHVHLQRDLARGVAVEAGYLGSRGLNLPFYGDPNAVPSEYGPDGTKRIVPGASRRFPSWGRVRTRANVARSSYHGLVLGATRRTADRLGWQAAYTYGHATDTWSGGLVGNSDFENGAGNAVDFFDPEYEFGPSNFDVRHNLVLNAVLRLPWEAGNGGLRGALAGGWHLAAILHLSSGIPLTPYIGFDHAGDLQADPVQRPDQVGPVRYTRTAAQWFDPSAFAVPAPGTFGSARRNALRAPGVKVADLAVFKEVPIGAARVQVRIEAFNAFNWVNLGLPAATVLFNRDGTPFAGAGRITSTSTPGRQVQLGLRVAF
jgi:hypothetical protein